MRSVLEIRSSCLFGLQGQNVFELQTIQLAGIELTGGNQSVSIKNPAGALALTVFFSGKRLFFKRELFFLRLNFRVKSLVNSIGIKRFKFFRRQLLPK